MEMGSRSRFGFDSTQAMDDHIIREHNALVAPNDIVYMIGDISFRKPHRTAELIQRMNGRKFLIPGNRDHSMWEDHPALQGLVNVCEPLHTTEVHRLTIDPDAVDVQSIVLCHFPLLVWDHIHHGAWHLHGHSHGFCQYPGNTLMYDVGIDTTPDLSPTSFDALEFIMESKIKMGLVWYDHHRPKDPATFHFKKGAGTNSPVFNANDVLGA